MCYTNVQQYFRYVHDVTSVTMATTECLERTLQFPVFAKGAFWFRNNRIHGISISKRTPIHSENGILVAEET